MVLGSLRVPQGKLLAYFHGGYGSTYEDDLLISIEKGVVTGTNVRHNGTSDEPDGAEGYGDRRDDPVFPNEAREKDGGA